MKGRTRFVGRLNIWVRKFRENSGNFFFFLAPEMIQGKQYGKVGRIFLLTKIFFFYSKNSARIGGVLEF